MVYGLGDPKGGLMARLPEFNENNLTAAQKAVYDRINSGPRGGVRGPFKALLQSPELGDLVQAVGGHLRYNGGLPGHLRELAILVTGRHASAQYEFFAHAPIGIDEGLDPEIVEAVRTRCEPVFSDNNTELVYRFAKQLNESQNVDDTTFNNAVDAFGHPGVVELVVLCGYYTLIAMTLNTFEITPPAGEEPFDE